MFPSFSNFKPGWELCFKFSQDIFFAHPENTVEWTCHADIRDVSRSTFKNPFIRRLDMRMGPDNRLDTTCQVIAHRDFFTCCFRVNVNEDCIDFTLDFSNQFIDCPEWIAERR